MTRTVRRISIRAAFNVGGILSAAIYAIFWLIITVLQVLGIGALSVSVATTAALIRLP